MSWREIMGIVTPQTYAQNPQNHAETQPVPSSANIAHETEVAASEPERINEATLAPATDPTACGPVELPPCPICDQVRYWLASGGRVLCGTKQCASALRFQLVALEFHPVN